MGGGGRGDNLTKVYTVMLFPKDKTSLCQTEYITSTENGTPSCIQKRFRLIYELQIDKIKREKFNTFIVVIWKQFIYK